MVRVVPCESRRDLKLFESVPEILHQENPYFAPPFPGSIIKMFQAKSPYQRQGKLMPFLAYQGDKLTGRIVATVQRTHNEYHKDKTGFFGFFDFIDDIEVAKALLDMALKALREEGMDLARGPFNPTINDDCGLLVEGFESMPFVLMPFNPSYYLSIYDRIGLTPARNLYAFYKSAEGGFPPRIEKIVERVRKQSGVTLRSVEMKNLSSELKILHKLYNETLDRNWSFVPVSLEDLEFTANDLKEIADPDLILIAEKDGVPVGFSMALPNINEFLWRSRKSKGLIRFLRLAWLFKTKRPREARLIILGISPAFRKRGIEALFYYETFMRGRQKYIGGELSWVEETNEEITRAIEAMGAQKYKTYRLYEKAIA